MGCFCFNKKVNFRFFVEGKPVVLFENDKIYLKSLDKAKIDLNELLMNCRMNGYFELNELDKIILETNGKFTFYPKTSSRPLKLGDLHQEVQKEFIPTILILQGTIIYENLELIHHNQKWLEQIMKVHGINLQEIVKEEILDSAGIRVTAVNVNVQKVVFDKER